jgi:adenylate cyclase
MKEPVLREALSRVQDIIMRNGGTPLNAEGEKALEAALREAIGGFAKSTVDENFLSREVTVLLADLRGFTSISAVHPAGVVLEMLNRYLVRMSGIIAKNRGTIDKFMGDSIMVLFGAPVSHPEDVRNAVTCAVEMQVAMDDLNAYHKGLGLPELYMGIGINTGTVMAGLLGSEVYSEYTVIGDEVNLASRIESFSLRGQVLVSRNTYERCRDYLSVGEPMDVYVKGKPHPVSLIEVVGIPSLGLEVPRQEIRRSPRIEVKMPFAYQRIESKIVMPEVLRGTILDISYHGVLAEIDREPEPYSDIKLELDLPLVGSRASDIYAKVLKVVNKAERRWWAALEFTSVGVESDVNIRRFIQLLIQGSENK